MPALPAPSLPRPDDPDTFLVGTARVDRSGRVHERALLRALGWEPGHELELDTTNGMIAIASVPGGRHRVDDRGALALPAAARRSSRRRDALRCRADEPGRGNIALYTDDELDTLARWIASDGLPLDRGTRLVQMRHELGFTRRGSRIDERCGAALDRARR